MVGAVGQAFAVEIPPQDAQRLRRQRQEQVGSGLALHHVEHGSVPVDRVDAQGGHLRGPQPVVRHQVQDAVVTVAGSAVEVDRADQGLHRRPFEGLGRQLTAVGSRRLDGIEWAIDDTLIPAEAHEASQMPNHMLQRVTGQLAAAQRDIAFDVRDPQRAQVLRCAESPDQEVAHRHRMVFARRQRQATQFQQVSLISGAQLSVRALIGLSAQPPGCKQVPSVGTLCGVEDQRPARNTATHCRKRRTQMLCAERRLGQARQDLFEPQQVALDDGERVALATQP